MSFLENIAWSDHCWLAAYVHQSHTLLKGPPSRVKSMSGHVQRLHHH